jgi:hypothetical protein
MKGSWKTTMAGVAAILTALGSALTAIFDGNPSTNVEIATTVSAIMAGIGLIMARDNNVSSEQAGVK